MSVLNRDVELWKAMTARLTPAVRAHLLKIINIEDPPQFLPFVEKALANGQSKGNRDSLAKFLLDRGLLVQVLCGPEVMTLPEAIEVMRHALRAEPRFDLMLLRHLTDPSRSWPEDISAGEMMRVLDLLRACGGIGPHLLMLMRRFLRVSNSQVRSRAVRLVTASHPAFIEAAFGDSDPRVRSNLIESVCEGLPKFPQAVTNLLARGATDANHRVATTALYYQALHGDQSADRRLHDLLNHQAPAYRSAAAWALGKLSASRAHDTSSAVPEPESELAGATGPSEH